MDLTTCYQQNAGTAILIPGGGAGNNGQCVQWAETVYHDVHGLAYIWTPGAIDWWNRADEFGITQNFDLIPAGGPIQQGDFIVYDGRIGSVYGHIDVASQDGTIDDFWAYDSNWDAKDFHDAYGYPTLHEVHHTGILNSYILGYIRKKGGYMGFNYNSAPTPDQKAAFIQRMCGRPATQAELDNTTQPWGELNGVVANEVFADLSKSEKEFADYKANPPGFTQIAQPVYTRNQ